MRNPSGRSVGNKLVFIYPTLIEQSINSIPFNTFVKGDNDNLGDALRAFFSVSVLKEILVSNSLNLITLASSYDTAPIKKDETQTLINSLLRSDRGSYSNYEISKPSEVDPVPQVDRYTLQQKINERIKTIKKIISFDPRLKKLNPFMEIITLENLFDVPVIVGTWPYTVDLRSMFSILAGSIILRKPLNNINNVILILNYLRNLKEDNLTDLFTLTDIAIDGGSVKPGQSVVNQNTLPGGSPSEYDKARNKVNELATIQNTSNNSLVNYINKKRYEYALDKEQKEAEKAAVIGATRMLIDELKPAEIMFRLVLDPMQLAIRYGLSKEVSQTTNVFKSINPQTQLLFRNVREQFFNFLIGFDSVLYSINSLYMPRTYSDEWKYDYIDLRNSFMEGLEDRFDRLLPLLQNDFNALMQSSEITSGALMDVKKYKAFCMNVKSDFVAIIKYLNSNTVRIPTTFNLSHVQEFITGMDKIANYFTTMRRQIESRIKTMYGDFGSKSIKNITDTVQTSLTVDIDTFFSNYAKTSDPTTTLAARFYVINNDQPGLVTPELHQQILIKSQEIVDNVVITMFLYIFLMNFCEYLDVAEYELDLKANDVLNIPNYCLAIPIEIINVLYAIYIKRTWKDAVKFSLNTPLMSNNPKEVVKRLYPLLGIPNLMVVDTKKKEVYTRFQYSVLVEKIKFNALDIFVKSHLQDNESGISQVFY